MKKLFITLSFCFLLVVGVTSCKSKVISLPTTETTKSVVITETVHDTVFKIEKDNSSYQALLECQNGKVVIKSKVEKQSKNGKLEPPTVKIEDNKIFVDCNLKEQQLYAKWKSQNRNEYLEVLKKIPIVIENNLNGWQMFQIWCGRIFLLIIIGFISFKILKFKKIL